MKERRFTPLEATRTLPLVKRIARDILDNGRKAREIVSKLGDNAYEDDEFCRLTNRLHDLFRELEEIGCSFKDWNFEIGLVDFPARIDGQEVLLCWRSDEEEIRHFHGYEDGYAGRREIPAKYFKVPTTA